MGVAYEGLSNMLPVAKGRHRVERRCFLGGNKVRRELQRCKGRAGAEKEEHEAEEGGDFAARRYLLKQGAKVAAYELHGEISQKEEEG